MGLPFFFLILPWIFFLLLLLLLNLVGCVRFVDIRRRRATIESQRLGSMPCSGPTTEHVCVLGGKATEQILMVSWRPSFPLICFRFSVL